MEMIYALEKKRNARLLEKKKKKKMIKKFNASHGFERQRAIIIIIIRVIEMIILSYKLNCNL